jgi:hypothetical protein
MRQETVMVSTPGQLPEDIEILKKRYPLRLPKSAGEKSFQLEETLELPPTAGDLKNLVSYTLEPRVQECRMVSGKLVIRGSAVVHVVFMNEENRLSGSNLEMPFSQLAEPEGELGADARCEVRMAVTGLELDPDPEGKLQLKANLLAQFLVDDREILELTEDAYSPGRQVQPKVQELDLPQILDQQSLNIPVRQTVRQTGREIADVTYLPDCPTLRRGPDTRVELPGQFQVLWYDDQDVLQSANARTQESREIPAAEDARMDVTVLPGAAPSAGTGSGIELKGETVLDITTTSRRGLPMVTGLTIGEETQREPNRPSLVLRRAGKAGLWNIAKSTGSTVSAIRKANALEEEPAPEQILLIPVS